MPTKSGDVITSVKGVQIQNAEQIQAQVQATHTGNTLQFEVNRSGLTQIITVRPEQLPDAAAK